jgi:hypothetical protein
VKSERIELPTVLRRCAAVFCCAALLLFSLRTHSQEAGKGSIQGIVSDSTGAVVANASVTLAESATGLTLNTKSDGSGIYSFPNINIGTYTLTVTAPNFETFVKTNNVLEVGSNISLNVTMTVGRQAQTIMVTTENLALQTEDASFKQTIDSNEVTEMPLNGRLLTNLIQFAGAEFANNPGDSTGSKFTWQSTGLSIAGAPGNSVSWTLDGGVHVDFMGGTNLPLPFPDAVSQFSVETSVLGSQNGMHSGAAVDIVTRSGANAFHGSGFEFLRNNFIDATNFFAAGKDTLHQNQYGGTFGGPVRIPRLFNGTDKLFFFFAYQWEKSDSASANSTAYVPTAANLQGDFSNTDPPPGAAANNCGKPQQLFDPITGLLLPGNKYASPPTWNASALKLEPYLPAINPARDPYNCGLVYYALPSEFFDKELDTRVDYTINSTNSLYVAYYLDGYQAPAFYSPTDILLTANSGNIEQTQSLTIGWNHVFTSNLVDSVHLTGIRRRNLRGYNSADINAATLGITIFQYQPIGLQLSDSTSGKNHGFSIGGGSNSKAVINDNTPFAIADDLTWVKGKHQFIFGGGYIRNELNLNNTYNGNGTFSFSGIYSGNGPTGSGAGVGSSTNASPGDANLDFLDGSMNPTGFNQSRPQQNALRGPITTLYAQDTFHASKRLTVVAGIRWQPYFVPPDVFHRGMQFNDAAFLANQVSTVYPTAPAGSFYYGDKGVPAGLTKGTPLHFNPNFGVTYDVFGNGKTVVRAGSELAYDDPNFFITQRVQQSPPFATNTTPNTSNQLCFSEPWLIGGTGYGCAQVGGVNSSPFPMPPVPTAAAAIFPAQSQYIVAQPQWEPPNTLQWTASIQQQLARGWMVEAQYVGSRTQHMPQGIPLSPAVFIPGVWGAGGTGCAGIVTTGPAAVKPGTAGTNCSTTGNENSRFALTIANPTQGNQYLGGGGGSLIESDSAYSNYNGLILTVQHRLSSTFSLDANYTWSKCMNDVDPQGDISATQVENPSNPRMDYGLCGSENKNIFNASLIAKSAFPLHGVLGYVVNNWELAPLVHITSGQPFTVSAGTDGSLTDVGNDRPNRIPGVNPYNYVKIYAGAATLATRSYLNQAAFCTYGQASCAANAPALGTYGNIGRNSFYGPMLWNSDAQLSRLFPIKEKLTVDLRIEAFNVLNHPSFSNPNSSNPSSGSFGEITGTSNSARVFQLGGKVSF